MTKKLLIILLVSPALTFAWEIQSSHSCSKPYKPYEFSSRDELDNFLDDIERYKDCINDFVDEEKQNIRTHQDSINNAIEEWNDFVNRELN